MTTALLSGVIVVTGATPAQSGESSLSSRALDCAETNGRVTDLDIHGNTVFVGGTFTRVVGPDGTVFVRSNAAAVDLRSCQVLPWDPQVNGAVLSLAATSTAVYVGGEFTTVRGVARRNLAAVHPLSGASTSFAPRVDGFVGSMDTSSTRLYVAGGVSAVNGQARARAAAFDLATGALDSQWKPRFDQRVDAVAVSPSNDRVYAGGVFTTVNRELSRSIAAVHPATGLRLEAFKPDMRVQTTDLVALGSTVLAGMAGPGGRLVAFDLSGRIKTYDQVDGNVQAVAILPGDEVVGGGHFTWHCADGTLCGNPIERRKLFSAGADGQMTSFAPRVNSVFGVWSLAYDPATGRLVAGGDFTKVGYRDVNHLAFFGSS